MQESNEKAKAAGGTSYLSSLGAFALAFGCCVGWGAFVMPGSTFLPIGGPAGAAAGLILGAVAMLILAVNYHYLMGHYPDGGGTYTYTKKCFGYDHGFLCAWFLILTYIAIIWANATALPLIARTVLGSTFQFGFEYEIAGFHIYLGEIMLAEISLLIAALICLRRRLAVRTQILMAGILLVFVVICFAAAYAKSGGTAAYEPPYPSGRSHFGGIFTMFSLAPWAYVGFESISHSAGEAAFSHHGMCHRCGLCGVCISHPYFCFFSSGREQLLGGLHRSARHLSGNLLAAGLFCSEVCAWPRGNRLFEPRGARRHFHRADRQLYRPQPPSCRTV